VCTNTFSDDVPIDSLGVSLFRALLSAIAPTHVENMSLVHLMVHVDLAFDIAYQLLRRLHWCIPLVPSFHWLFKIFVFLLVWQAIIWKMESFYFSNQIYNSIYYLRCRVEVEQFHHTNPPCLLASLFLLLVQCFSLKTNVPYILNQLAVFFWEQALFSWLEICQNFATFSTLLPSHHIKYTKRHAEYVRNNKCR
jgi:hypothetical protein